MTTAIRPVSSRRRYQHEVETLLEQIRRTVGELRRLKAAGVRGPGLSEHKRELAAVRRQLAALVERRTMHTA